MNSIVNEKTNLTTAVISHIVNNITVADPRLKSINKDKAEKFIREIVLAKLNLRSKTAAELAEFNIAGSRKEVLIKQVADTMIANLDSLM